MSSRWIRNLGYPTSPYPEGSAQDIEYYQRITVPVSIFFEKIFISAAFLNVYQVGFNEDVIFPFYKRATSIGIVNFIARVVTISAPMVAEVDKPLPQIILVTFISVALICSFFLPSKQDQEDFKKR